MTERLAQAKTEHDDRALAGHALENVCSTADPGRAVGVYSREFLDHVNARDYRGHEGIRESLALYQLLFRDGDLRIRVEDQVAEGDRVVSRWVADGHNRGRPLRLWGITISHIADGEIVEDWSASDNLDVLRQLGPGRVVLLGIDWLRARFAGGRDAGRP
jgi:ketosteroid isomerase-like protein